MSHRKYFPDENGQLPWEAAGIPRATWIHHANGRQTWRERYNTVRGTETPTPTPEPSKRRGWATAITDTFGGAWSTISKKKSEFEEILGYSIPSFYERGSDAEKAFLLDYAHQCVPHPTQPQAAQAADGLPQSLKAKHEATMRALRRNLEREFHNRVSDRAHKLMDEVLIPHWLERVRQAESLDHAFKGIYTKQQYQLLLKCLHPDSNCDEAQYNEAFRLVREQERLLMKPEVPKPRGWEDMPKNREELLARRQAYEAAKRNAKRST